MISIETKLEAIRLYESGLNVDQIAPILNIGRGRIYKYFKSINFKCRNASDAQRWHKLNQRFFQNVDNENKAYWLGFVSADGNVHCNTVQIDLHASDGGHLEKFNKDLEADYKVVYRDTVSRKGTICHQSRLSFRSEQMVEDLANLGVKERKTYNLNPWDGPQELMRHYWRGYFDGDGSLYTGSDNKSFVGLVAKSSIIVDTFNNWVYQNTGHTATRRDIDYKSVDYVRWSGNGKVKDISALMYANASIFLDRKYKIYERFQALKPNLSSTIRSTEEWETLLNEFNGDILKLSNSLNRKSGNIKRTLKKRGLI